MREKGKTGESCSRLRGCRAGQCPFLEDPGKRKKKEEEKDNGQTFCERRTSFTLREEERSFLTPSFIRCFHPHSHLSIQSTLVLSWNPWWFEKFLDVFADYYLR